MSLKLTTMRILLPVVGRFPKLFYLGAELMGAVLFWLRPGLRKKVLRNMAPFAQGKERRVLARKVVQNVVAYYVDLCSLPYRNMSSFEADHLVLEHGERLAALHEPGPVIAMSAHTGNAELAIQALTFRGRPFVALVEEQEPASWANYLLRLRSGAGGSFHETNFAGIRACIETLHEGGLVGFMGDRDLQGNGQCVMLAGQCVRLPRGPWDIARRTNALVFPIFSSRERGDRLRVKVGVPFRVGRTGNEDEDIAAAIREFAVLLEEHLRRDPSQWAVTENFWQVHRCG
jgi:KDO2-lipid IV(A) lauroyltransferase